MPYRNEVDALEARRVILEGEVADRTRERDAVAAMLAEARARLCAEWQAEDRRMGGPARRLRRVLWIISAVSTAIIISGVLYLVSQRTRRDHIDENLDRFEEFANEMCACKNTTCVQDVMNRAQTWAGEAAKQDHQAMKLKPDDERMKRGAAIGERFTACYTKTFTPSQAGYQHQGGAQRGRY